MERLEKQRCMEYRNFVSAARLLKENSRAIVESYGEEGLILAVSVIEKFKTQKWLMQRK